MHNQPLNINDLSPHLFWDVKRETLDAERNKSFIIQRVITYGAMEDWFLVEKHYGIKEIGEIAKGFKSLDPKSLAFLVVKTGIPKEEFRCYIIRQSQPIHWDF